MRLPSVGPKAEASPYLFDDKLDLLDFKPSHQSRSYCWTTEIVLRKPPEYTFIYKTQVSMHSKLDIYICLQYRDKFSVGQNRIRFGRRAFHWSIVAFDGQYHRFDVTDGIVSDPVTNQDLNPNRIWIYRHNVSNDLLDIPRYLGSVQINQKSVEMTIQGLEEIFDTVPLPDPGADRSEHNCVSWTVDALHALQDVGCCQRFDLEQFQNYALTHADRRLADFKNRPDPIKYPPNQNKWLRLF